MTRPANLNQKQVARVEIDRQLDQAGWLVQDSSEMNILAGLGDLQARVPKGAA